MTSIKPPKGYMTLPMVADFLGCRSRETIRARYVRGRFPAPAMERPWHPAGKTQKLWREADIKAYAKQYALYIKKKKTAKDITAAKTGRYALTLTLAPGAAARLNNLAVDLNKPMSVVARMLILEGLGRVSQP